MDIYYRIGYAIFLMPCQIILTKVNPRWWMPSNEMAWGVMTGTRTLPSPAHESRHLLVMTFAFRSADGCSKERQGHVRSSFLHRRFRGKFLSRNHFDSV
jgi:hypothetical protein